MRRILFGAIWLTGFLAVLLAWGMMWGRSKGEGPRRIIGVIAEPTSTNCQLVIVNPENGARLQVGKRFPECGIKPLGWSPDQQWFYYIYKTGVDHDLTIYQLERIDKDFRNLQVLAEDVGSTDFGAPVSATRNLRHLIYAHRPQNQTEYVRPDLYIMDQNGQNLLNITGAIPSTLIPNISSEMPISPNQTTLAVPARDRVKATNYVYLIRLDGSSTVQIPNFSIWTNIPDFLLWTNAPEWLVYTNLINPATGSYTLELHKIRPNGMDDTLLVTLENTAWWMGWTHQSGVIGFQEGSTFNAMSVDTGQILWTLDGVERIYNGTEWDSYPANLDKDWVHFRMTDGRFARCRIDGSDLTFYGGPTSLPAQRIWDWSVDKEWVWFETPGTQPNLVDVMRVQRNTNRMELILDEVYPTFWKWSPDGKWAYYFDDGGGPRFRRIRADGTGKPELVTQASHIGALEWTPPYQAEWQPTHTLAIGIGLMSFSTLTPIVLWRRRRK